MRRASLHTERDEGALTAVIEFLSAFTLFLMILTAFLSLAQLQMGSNDPDVDRLDRAASLGLDRLTSGEGWFVPMSDGLDYTNSTAQWHLASAEDLQDDRVQPGLMLNHRLDMNRIQALHNVTEDGMADGLGLDGDMSLHLSIRVVSSEHTNRTGASLFNGGTERGTASSSSTAYRSFQQDGELIRVVLEVHDGGRKNNILHITEVMVRPSSAGPEWIEVSNPNDFAIAPQGMVVQPHLWVDGEQPFASIRGCFGSIALAPHRRSFLPGRWQRHPCHRPWSSWFPRRRPIERAFGWARHAESSLHSTGRNHTRGRCSG